MKTIIAGGREFSDYKTLEDELTHLDFPITTVISGAARGADRLGEVYAQRHNIPVERHPADWDTYEKSAGYRRNEEMADVADALVAFWDGESRGTKHMIELAQRKKLKVVVVRYDLLNLL